MALLYVPRRVNTRNERHYFRVNYRGPAPGLISRPIAVYCSRHKVSSEWDVHVAQAAGRLDISFQEGGCKCQTQRCLTYAAYVVFSFTSPFH